MRLPESLAGRRIRWIAVGAGTLLVAGTVIYRAHGPTTRAAQIERRAARLLGAERRELYFQDAPGWLRWGLRQIFSRLNHGEGRDVQQELVALGPQAIPHIARALAADRDPRMRAFAAWALGEMVDPRALMPLTNALARETDETAVTAIGDALAGTGEPAAVPAIAAVYNASTNDDTRAELLGNLGKFHDVLARQILTNALVTATNEELRTAAIRGLAELADRSAFSNIASALLKDPDMSVRSSAASAIGAFNLPQSVTLLLKSIETDSFWNVRQEAALALHNCSGRDVGEEAAGLLNEEPNDSVRQALLPALARSTNPAAASALMNCATNDPSQDLRETAKRELREKTGTLPLAGLVEALRFSPFNEVREAALGATCDLQTDDSRAALAEFIAQYPSNAMALTSWSGDPKLPQVYDLLVRQLSKGGPPAGMRENIIRNLGHCGNSNAIPLLLQVLTNNEVSSTRASAAAALAELHAVEALPVLTNLLASCPDREMRACCASALGSFRDPRAVTALLRALDSHKDQHLHATVCGALATIGDPGAVPALTHAAGKGGSLRAVAIRSIAEIGTPEAVSFLRSELGKAKDDESADLVRLLDVVSTFPDRSFVPLVTLHLDDIDQHAVEAAVKAAGRLNATNAVRQLMCLATNAGKNVRTAACRALGELGDASALPALAQVMKNDRYEEARVKAAEALALIGDTRAIPELRGAVGDFAAAVRNEVICSLGHLGDTNFNSVAAVAGLLKQEASNVRSAACYYLVEVGGEEAVAALKETLSDREWDVRLGAACGLAARGISNGVGVLGEALERSDVASPVLGLAALGLLKSTEARELLRTRAAKVGEPLSRLAQAGLDGEPAKGLVQLLGEKDTELRRAAAFAFVYVTDPVAIPALNQACFDHEADVQDAARWAVRRIQRLDAQRGTRSASRPAVTQSAHG